MTEVPPQARHCAIRAVQAVEQIGSPAAVRLLTLWATGGDGASLTRGPGGYCLASQQGE